MNKIIIIPEIIRKILDVLSIISIITDSSEISKLSEKFEERIRIVEILTRYRKKYNELNNIFDIIIKEIENERK